MECSPLHLQKGIVDAAEHFSKKEVAAQAQLDNFNKHMEMNGSHSLASESEGDTRNRILALDALNNALLVL